LLFIEMRHTLLKVFLLAFLTAGSVSICAAQGPGVVEAVAPIYPWIALSARTSGAVIVEAQVSPRGTVTSVQIIEGAATLRPISELTARRWLFAPTRASEVRTVRLTFRFTIVPDKTPAAERSPIFRPPYGIEIRDFVPQIKNSVDSDPPMKRKHK
jgi:TonB family protein